MSYQNRQTIGMLSQYIYAAALKIQSGTTPSEALMELAHTLSVAEERGKVSHSVQNTLPPYPMAAGTYTLQLVVSGGVGTLSWVAA